MIYQAILSNPGHPEYGVAAIPFPLSREEYASSMEELSALEIGDAVRQDCKVEEITGGYPVLKRLEGQTVNADELDYLAKRLDSFCEGEDTQFQAMVEKLHLTDIRDFINLSFCCQQATVIADFSDLAQIGREHYLNLHGGCAKKEELDRLDGEETACQLEPENTPQLRLLAENLDQFDFVPQVKTPEEYGRYMIRDSGHFEYDPNLEGFYDYEEYGLQRVAREQGCFTAEDHRRLHQTLSQAKGYVMLSYNDCSFYYKGKPQEHLPLSRQKEF